jgi:hypothetical protein
MVAAGRMIHDQLMGERHMLFIMPQPSFCSPTFDINLKNFPSLNISHSSSSSSSSPSTTDPEHELFIF